jgi:hypothetical protein
LGIPAAWKPAEVSAASLTRRWTSAVRQGISTFLGIAGTVAIVIGLLYLFADGSVPHVLQGSAHTGHHARRAAACLAGGAACVIGSWLIRVRRRSLAAAAPSRRRRRAAPSSGAGPGGGHRITPCTTCPLPNN